MTKEIQGQLYTKQAVSKGRILWRIYKDEETEQDIKQWLLDSCKCKYYVLVSATTEIKKDFVKDCLKKIRALENALAAVKAAGITISKNQISQEAKICLLVS